jgi:hypothetical protein
MNEIIRFDQSARTLIPESMGQAMQLAGMMAKARLVPKDLQNAPADCLLVIQAAARWGVDPYAVAQETSVIQGRLMYSGKLTAAVVNARGGLVGRLAYDYRGQGDDRTVTVSGLLRGEAEPRTAEVRLRDVRTTNKMWQQQTDQQLAYSAARIWARRHTPDLLLGIWSPEEFDDQPARPMPGKHADGQDNRFYREPAHDPQASEVIDAAPVESEEAAADHEAREAFLSSTREIIRRATDWKVLGTWWNSEEQRKARRDFDLTPEEVADLVAFVTARISALKNGKAA